MMIMEKFPFLYCLSVSFHFIPFPIAHHRDIHTVFKWQQVMKKKGREWRVKSKFCHITLDTHISQTHNIFNIYATWKTWQLERGWEGWAEKMWGMWEKEFLSLFAHSFIHFVWFRFMATNDVLERDSVCVQYMTTHNMHTTHRVGVEKKRWRKILFEPLAASTAEAVAT